MANYALCILHSSFLPRYVEGEGGEAVGAAEVGGEADAEPAVAGGREGRGPAMSAVGDQAPGLAVARSVDADAQGAAVEGAAHHHAPQPFAALRVAKVQRVRYLVDIRLPGIRILRIVGRVGVVAAASASGGEPVQQLPVGQSAVQNRHRGLGLGVQIRHGDGGKDAEVVLQRGVAQHRRVVQGVVAVCSASRALLDGGVQAGAPQRQGHQRRRRCADDVDVGDIGIGDDTRWAAGQPAGAVDDVGDAAGTTGGE